MPLFRRDDDNALALLAEPTAEALERDRLTRAGGAADPPIPVGVLVVVVGVKEHRRAVIEIQSQEDPVVVAQLIGGKGKRRSHTGGQRIAPRFSLNIRVKREDRERGEKSLLIFVVAASGDHIHGHAELFHLCHPLLQRFGIGRRDLDERVHIIEILALPVHHILEVEAGADGAVKLFIVLSGIAHLPHTGAVHHRCLRDLGEDLLL